MAFLPDSATAPRVVGLGTKRYDVETSLVPQGLSFDWSLHIDAFNELVDAISDDPNGYLFPLDETQCPLVDDSLLKVTKNLLTDRFTPSMTKGLQTEVSKAMSQHIKVALVAEVAKLRPDPHVLIIGSGFGNDVRRVRRALLNSGKLSCSIIALEPCEERLRQSQLENPDVTHILADYDRGYQRLLQSGPFDLIVCTMSLQHVIGRNNDNSGPISSLLSYNGVLIGTHFDHDSFFSHVPQIMNERGRGVSVGARSHDPETKLGVHPTQIYDTKFCDPYINSALVAEYCISNALDYRYLKGTQALSTYGNRDLARKARSKSVCTSLVSLLVAHHCRPLHFSVSSAGQPYTFKPARVVREMDPYYSTVGQIVLAPKRDGRRVIAALRDGKLSFEGRDVPCATYDEAVYLQLEWCADKIYLVDAHRASWLHDPVPFPLRLHLMNLVLPLLALELPTELNDFVLPLHAEDLHMFFLRVKKAEGFVMHNLHGFQSVGFSDAVYVKQRYTVDVRENGKIVERFVDAGEVTAYYRDRPDKTEPNPASTINDMLEAPSYKSVVDMMLKRSDPHPLPADLSALFAARDIFSLDARFYDILSHVHQLDIEHYELLPDIIARNVEKQTSLKDAVWSKESHLIDDLLSEPP